MHINFSEYSDAGGRRKNEDMALIVSYPRSTIAIVADGLGGHGDGDVASRLAVHAVSEMLSQEYISKDLLIQAIERTNQKILKKQELYGGMKTTIAALWFGEGKAFAAHVGDSRIYHFRDQKIIYQSVDHSVSQMAVLMGEITADQIRFHCDRNRLTRALGSREKVKTDVLQLNANAGDAFLLCTDGFWELIPESEMLEDLQHAADAQSWLCAMRKRVEARQQPDADNSTAIVLLIP